MILTICPLVADTEAAQTIDFTSWETIVSSILLLLAGWAFKLLRSKWKVETEHEELDATKSLWEQRNFLIDNRIIPFAVNTAEHWVITQLPAMVREVREGEEFHWHDHWYGFRNYVRSRVLQKFASENLDVLKFFTERELQDLIDRQLVRLITNLPASVRSLLPEEVVGKLSAYATEFINERSKNLLGYES